mgnify:CR=1 FL=1
MKKLLALCTAVLCMMLVGCGGGQKTAEKKEEAKPIILGLDDNFPPMGFVDENNKIVGFDIDLATEAAKRLKPDLIVTDIKMPKMDGHRLLKMVRDNERLKDVPFVLFSSLINEEMRLKGEQLGASGQISKPEISMLIGLLDNLIFGKPLKTNDDY